MILSSLASILSSVISSALAPKPDKPSISTRRDSLTSSVRDAAAPRELVIGKVQKGGTIVYLETVDNETQLLMAVTVAAHQVTAIDEIYFFDELAVNQAGVIQPKFVGFLEYEKHLGSSSQTASALLLASTTKWTADHRLRGIAYLVFKLKFNRDVYNQIPNVSCVVRGAQLFDSRDSVTRYSTNAALAIGFYLNHPTFGLGAAYGTKIDSTMLNAAANVCDEDVAIKAGTVLEFHGGSDVITIGDVLDQTGSLTIEARVYPSGGAAMPVLSKDSGTTGFQLQIDGTVARFITRGLSNVTLSTGADITVNAWNRVAAVWNAATGVKTIYVDGVQKAQATSVTGALVANATNLTLGSGFSGRIQDVRLWNTARTSTEVAAFDDKTLQGTETGLVGYWRLDEKRGTMAEDATETPNDGVITGATWIDDVSVLGTEKRYACNGVIYSDQSPRDIIEDMLTAMMGKVVPVGGKWHIRAAAFDAPTIVLTENDARDKIKIQTRRSRRDLFNSVRGLYLSPVNNFQKTDFPIITNATFETEDGGVRIVQDIELPFTISSSATQRLGFLHLLQNRQQISVTYPCKLSGLALRAGDFVEVTNARLGWTLKDFEVMDWKLVQFEDDSGVPAFGVDLELRETAATIFDFNPATDEVPIDPAPNTSLPSPFGNIALVSSFIERTGFTEIKHLESHGAWLGTIVGFIRNPLTGDLVVADQVNASANSFAVFDQFVQVPVVNAYYESPELDIDFDDIVRTFVEYSAFKGPGEPDSFVVSTSYDAKPAAGAYGGFKSMTKAVSAEGRYFKHRIDFDFSEGSGGYLSTMNAVVDKTTVFQQQTGVVIAVGGTVIDYPIRYHKTPGVSVTPINSASRVPTFAFVNATQFKPVVFNSSGTDVGGDINWISQGA